MKKAEQRTIEYGDYGRANITLTSEMYGDERLDTEVFINGGFICVVQGDYVDEFIAGLSELITNYHI